MFSLRFATGILIATLASVPTFAHEGHEHSASQENGSIVPAKEASPEWLAKARAQYPTDKCVVSGDKLGGDMGPAQDYVYKVQGKPDRLIRFCCKDCVKDFKKDPDQYLKELDSTAAGKPDSAKDSDHASHSH